VKITETVLRSGKKKAKWYKAISIFLLLPLSPDYKILQSALYTHQYSSSFSAKLLLIVNIRMAERGTQIRG